MDTQKFYEKIGSDYNTVIQRFCNNEAMLSKFVLSFPEDPTYNSLAEAIEAGDYQGIESQAHGLKGVSANLGFDKLMEACAEIVACVRNDKTEDIPKHFLQAKEEYEKILAEL